jgi:hypothetical protein
MAYIAHHFHWPYEQIMAMDHYERQQWVGQITAINTRWLPESEDAVNNS